MVRYGVNLHFRYLLKIKFTCNKILDLTQELPYFFYVLWFSYYCIVYRIVLYSDLFFGTYRRTGVQII